MILKTKKEGGGGGGGGGHLQEDGGHAVPRQAGAPRLLRSFSLSHNRLVLKKDCLMNSQVGIVLSLDTFFKGRFKILQITEPDSLNVIIILMGC